MRIEPPPSFACATGTIPRATAAAEPPLEPPVVRVGSYGLRDGGHGGGSADGRMPSSLVLVLPQITKPARRSASTRWLSPGERRPACLSGRVPAVYGVPAT